MTALQLRAIMYPNCATCGCRICHDEYIRQCGECAKGHDAAFMRGQSIDDRRDRIAGEAEFRNNRRNGNV